MIRIITGTCADVERQVNALSDDYAVNAWSLWSYEGVGMATAVMLHGSIYRQATIAAGVPSSNGRR
jgi:hypothetical protein